MSDLAGRARALVAAGRTGTLTTLSRRRPGWPFGSLMPYAPDERGRPVFLISRLAVHTSNLEADGRASLLVSEGEPRGSPLEAARVTLLGTAAAVPEHELAQVRKDYLTRHPEAEQWAGFGDFRFYRLEVIEAYVVGGFGVMGWIGGEQYSTGKPG